MVYKVYNPKDVPTPPPNTWSNIKVHDNGHFHVAGIVAEGGSMYEQTKKIFTVIQSLIQEAGGTMDDIMSLQIFVNNLNENTEVWRARSEFFTGDYPCSTLIEVARVGSPDVYPPMRVEINCTGYIGGSR